MKAYKPEGHKNLERPRTSCCQIHECVKERKGADREQLQIGHYGTDIF